MKYDPVTIDAHETIPIIVCSIPNVAIAIPDVIIDAKRNDDGIPNMFLAVNALALLRYFNIDWSIIFN